MLLGASTLVAVGLGLVVIAVVGGRQSPEGPPVPAAAVNDAGAVSPSVEVPTEPPGATPAPGAAPAPSAPAPQPATAAEVTTRITQLLGQRRGAQVSIAALDLTGDRRYRYPSKTPIRTSGVGKLNILETVLLRAQQTKHPLDPADTAAATAMIEHDDNNGADTLWDKYGSAEGFRAANRELGTKHTSPDIDRYWGLATSDADDQLTLLRNLLVDRPLDAASRSFALDLLGKVEPAQVWGVAAAADPGTKPLLKTGAINADNDNGLWTAGSVGIIEVRGHRVLLAVLTQHNASRQDGIDLVTRLATTAVAAVTAPTPTAR